MNNLWHCEQPMRPFDLIPAWVEIDGEIAAVTEDDLVYSPTGQTDPIWDGQETIGYGCAVCGTVTIIEAWLKEFMKGIDAPWLMDENRRSLVLEAARLLQRFPEQDPDQQRYYNTAIIHLVAVLMDISPESAEQRLIAIKDETMHVHGGAS